MRRVAAYRSASGIRVVLFLCFAASAIGCEPANPDPDTGFRGTLLASPLEMPAFTLTDTDGRAFNLRERIAGRLTLLFFGYTHCPDVCPVHMASIATVLARFPGDVRNRVDVVFVSTDPARDSPARIREWLDGFAPGFIGLRGAIDEVNRIQADLGLAPAIVGEETDGEYDVGHAAQVIAFSPDGLAHIVYPFGTRQVDWLHDIPRLLEHSW